MERKIEPVENTKKIYAYTNAQTNTHTIHTKTDWQQKEMDLFIFILL